MDINKFDYKEGDIVQIAKGEHTGRVGEIIGVTLSNNEKSLLYCVKLSDKSSFIGSACTMKIVKSS